MERKKTFGQTKEREIKMRHNADGKKQNQTQERKKERKKDGTMENISFGV